MFDHKSANICCRPAHNPISIPINILHESLMGKIRGCLCARVFLYVPPFPLRASPSQATIITPAFMLDAACLSTHTINCRKNAVHQETEQKALEYEMKVFPAQQT